MLARQKHTCDRYMTKSSMWHGEFLLVAFCMYSQATLLCLDVRYTLRVLLLFTLKHFHINLCYRFPVIIFQNCDTLFRRLRIYKLIMHIFATLINFLLISMFIDGDLSLVRRTCSGIKYYQTCFFAPEYI